MTTPTPNTVTVEVRQAHSYMGMDYKIGDVYDIDAQYADTVVAQGKATRVERDAAAPAPAAPASHPVAPMTTTDGDARGARDDQQ